MIKKLSIIAATTILISSNIYADESFYLSGGVGAAFVQKTKIEGVKAKSKQASPIISLAIGYDIIDNFRTELSYTHFFDPKVTTKNDSTAPTAGGTVTNKRNQKFSVDALLVNGYCDLVDAGPAKFFVGAGVAIASVKAKGSATQTTGSNVSNSNQTQTTNTVTNGNNVTTTRITRSSSNSSNSSSVTHKGKTSTNFAYNLIAGAAFKVNEDIIFDLKYLFTDCGKAKKFKDQKGRNARFRTHSVIGGFRFKV